MDVISNERERDDFRVLVRRRPAAGWGVPLTAGLALVAAVCGFLVGRLEASGGLFGKGSVGDLTGSMVLELQDGAYVEAQGLTDQIQYRGEDWKGTITVGTTADRTGAARLQGSASYVPTDSGPVVAHSWGTAAVTLDGQACAGTYGYSSYRDSGEGGGSMHLRCEDGSVLGATMTAGDADPPSADGSRNWTITVTLTAGYFFQR